MDKNSLLSIKKIDLPHFILIFSMLYVTLMLICMCVLHKTIEIFRYQTSAAAIVTPFWFILSDVIAEIYGFKIARKLLGLGLICQWVFCGVIYILIHVHSPNAWPYQSSYNYVFSGYLRMNLSVLLGVLVAGYINISLITKWKFLLQGKYFWLRSIGSSGIGEVLYTILVSTFVFYNTMSVEKLISFTVLSFFFKIICTIVFAYPVSIITYFIKRVEGFDIFDNPNLKTFLPW